MEVSAIWTDRWISRKTAVLSSFDLHLSRPDLHPMDMAAMPLWKSSLGQLYEYVFTDRFDIWDQSLCQYVLPGGGGGGESRKLILKGDFNEFIARRDHSNTTER